MHLGENQVAVLTIENAKAYSDILQDIWNQIQGKEGQVIFSEQEKMLKLSTAVECIFNPFSLCCNDKKILNKLYQEIKKQSDIFLQEKVMTLNARINTFLDDLLQQTPYALKYNQDMDILGLLKLYNVEWDCVGESVLEQMIEYLRVMNRVCNVKHYIFVGLKQYLTSKELSELYEFVFYEKISLCIIQSVYSPLISGERGWIIDEDLCIIAL